MATINLINSRISVDSSKDNVIIDKVIETIRGGRTLDVTGFADTTIQAGHVIIREDATGEFKPHPVEKVEVATLDLTGAVSTAGDLTITLNGTPTNVAVALSDTAIQVADKIRATAFAGFTVSGAAAQVIFTSDTVGDKVDATYVVGTSAGTTGVVTTTVQGTGIPAGHTAVGILTVSIRTDEPSAAIMTRGTVNEVPLKYPISAATKTALSDRIGYVII